MIDQDALFEILGLTVIGAPALLVMALGLTALTGHPLGERAIGRLVHVATVTGLLAAVSMLVLMLSIDKHHVEIEVGSWVKIHHEYEFAVKLLFDRLSVPFIILSFLLCGTIGAFANKYMHREAGFRRFFVFYAFFMLGMAITAIAGTIETLFFGWELVGLSSALLVAFYQDRPAPVRNGLRVWTVYRVSDAALLVAAVAMHHLANHGDFVKLLVDDGWPFGQPNLGTPWQVFLVGLLFLVAAAGKSALVPFSNWLPRAMEGPTPSSAVFYGALSVHLGAFLLLRVSPILDLSWLLSALVVLIGVATAIFAALAARVQTDIKCALSFASLTQVGIIVVEIGLGFRYIALFHMIGHGCLRTLQFVRAPSLLFDYLSMENAIGTHLPTIDGPGEHQWMKPWVYRLALDRGNLDGLLNDYIVRPFLRSMQWCDALERRWTDTLAGGQSRESDPHKSPHGMLEEML